MRDHQSYKEFETQILLLVLMMIVVFYSSSIFAMAGMASAQSVVATVPVGKGPSGVAVDSANGNVYVTNRYNGTVSVISGRTNQVIATIPLTREAYSVRDLDVDPVSGNVYVVNDYNSTLRD